MHELKSWINSSEAQELLKIIYDEIIQTKEDVMSGELVKARDKIIAAEYRYNIGYIEGLKFLERILTKESEDND